MQLNIFDTVVLGLVVQQDNTVGGVPVWIFLVVALLVVLVGIIWFLINENKEKSQGQDESASSVPPVAAQTDETSATKAAEVSATETADLCPRPNRTI